MLLVPSVSRCLLSDKRKWVVPKTHLPKTLRENIFNKEKNCRYLSLRFMFKVISHVLNKYSRRIKGQLRGSLSEVSKMHNLYAH